MEKRRLSKGFATLNDEGNCSSQCRCNEIMLLLIYGGHCLSNTRGKADEPDSIFVK